MALSLSPLGSSGGSSFGQGSDVARVASSAESKIVLSLKKDAIKNSSDSIFGSGRALDGIQISTGSDPATSAATAAGAARGSDFASALTGAFSRAAAAERTADDEASRFAAGDPAMGIHETIIDAEKASISMRYAVTLKNKVIEAYRELMNTPL